MIETTEDLELRIKELEKVIEDKDEVIDELKDDVKDLENKVEEAENYKPDFEGFSDSEIEAAFFSRNKIDNTMINDIKVELFFKNVERFKLEDFEEFIKTKAII